MHQRQISITGLSAAFLLVFISQANANGGTPRVRVEPPYTFTCVLPGQEEFRIANTKVNGQPVIPVTKGPVKLEVDLKSVLALTWPEALGETATDPDEAVIVLRDGTRIEGVLTRNEESEYFLLTGEMVGSGVLVEMDLKACSALRRKN